MYDATFARPDLTTFARLHEPACVQLKLDNGRKIRCDSTHFAPARFRGINHDAMRREHARSIVRRARGLRDGGIPTIFGGDDNFTADPFDTERRGNLRMRKTGVDGSYVSGPRLSIAKHHRIGDIKSDHHNPRLLAVDLPG